MIAKGNIVIKAVDGLKIDIKQVDQQSVSQTIDAMVQADPQLAWLKQAEARGDVDWQLVKEIHESFKYETSGLGPASQIIIAIIMAAVVGPAALSAFASMGTIGAAGLAAVATGAATNATTSFINNGGNLGAVFKDVTSSDALKGYVISGVTAGLTAGVFDGVLKTTTNPATGKVTVELSSLEGVGRFAGNQILQGETSALLGKALGQGGSASDALKTALFNTLAAASFNAVGEYTKGVFDDGSVQKIAIHAMVGGLLAEVTGGDFKTGALAAGANEALVGVLDNLVKGNDNLLTMSSQIVGVLAATAQKYVDASKLEKAAWVAKNASQYNRQLHREDHELAEQLAARSGGKYTVEQIEAQLRLSSVDGTGITGATDIVASGAGIYDTGGNWIALGDGQYVQNFEPADREIIAYIQESTNSYSWSLTAQTGFNSVNDKTDWSKTTSGTGPRDRLTGYPIDESGGYRVPIAIDGVAYTPRYLPCGSAECLATGANIDFADAGTLKWLRAANAKAINDVGWLMGAAAIPAGGTTTAILSNGSTAASLLSSYLKNELVSGLASSALSASFEKFAVASGVSEKVASQLSNGFGAAGVWDTITEKAVDIFKGK